MKQHENFIEEYLDFSLSADDSENFDSWLRQKGENTNEFLEMAHLDSMLYAIARPDEADPANIDSIKIALKLEDRKRHREQELVLNSIEKYLQKINSDDENRYPQVRIIPAWVWRTAAAACFVIIVGVILLVSFVFTPNKKSGRLTINSGVTCNEIYENDESLFSKTKAPNSAILYRKIIIHSYNKHSASNDKPEKMSISGPGIIIFKLWKDGYYYAES